jgi:hypothetical protein
MAVPDNGGGAVTIVRVGTNQKYAEGWDSAFGGRRSAAKAAKKPARKKASPKKAGKKSKK